VCRAWRTSVREVVLGDTATSRPCRYWASTSVVYTCPAVLLVLCMEQNLHSGVLLLCRPPMQATSEQAKPAATMNTCGAMMVGSNQSKDAVNDGEALGLALP